MRKDKGERFVFFKCRHFHLFFFLSLIAKVSRQHLFMAFGNRYYRARLFRNQFRPCIVFVHVCMHVLMCVKCVYCFYLNYSVWFIKPRCAETHHFFSSEAFKGVLEKFISIFPFVFEDGVCLSKWRQLSSWTSETDIVVIKFCAQKMCHFVVKLSRRVFHAKLNCEVNKLNDN